MHQRIFFITLPMCVGLLLLVCACDLISPPPGMMLWEATLLDGDNSTGIYRFPMIFHEKGVVLSAGYGVKGYSLVMVDKNSGNLLWQWNDSILSGYSSEPHLHNDILVFISDGGRLSNTMFGIDVRTGKTVWREQRFIPFELTGVGESFWYAINLGNQSLSIIHGNVKSGSIDLVGRVFSSDSLFLLGLIHPKAIIDRSSGDTLLTSVLVFQPDDPNERIYYRFLYNISKKREVYRKNLLQIGPILGPAITDVAITDNRLFLSTVWSIYCFDVMTGEQIWEYRGKTRGLGGFSDGFVCQDRWIATHDGTDAVGLEAKSGLEIWRHRGFGTGLFGYFAMNGVAYCSGMTAIDMQSGAILINSGGSYQRTCGGEGKIFTMNIRSVSAYRSAR